MKCTIVFFSLSGKTGQAAQILSERLSAVLCELKTQKPYPKNHFFRLLKGGMEVARKRAPALVSYPWGPQQELYILGTPVWNSGIAPALRTFLLEHSLKGKQVAAFATSLSGVADKCFAMMEGLLEEPLIATVSLRSDKEGFSAEELDKLALFSEKLSTERKVSDI